MIDTIIKYGAPWCKPCEKYDPVLDEFQKEHPNINVERVNIDKEGYPEMISSIPATFFVSKGNVVRTSTGAHTKFELESLLADANSKIK